MLDAFKEVGAILKGHFVLSSGLHSDTYLQCAKIFEYPRLAEKVCSLLAKKIKNELIRGFCSVDSVLSPAIGGITVGYEIAKQLDLRFMFCERINGKFILRRDFRIKEGEEILIVEDVITTGKSSLDTVKCVEENGGKIIGEASLVKRNSKIILPFPIVSLIELDIKNYNEKELPQELKNIPVMKPGSRYYL
ncbi:orotate phosphoribosyltransferase [Wolbachia endosymbiont of Pentidionis agamae]|uniref:orotate phosphoribosyltransferase n=1 Tax=Wolbachia endosymbiont of Pentidionis agamae TaxID=3110435 RepID=UPI002FD6DD75